MQLELFYRENCPASEKVRDFITQTGLRTRIAYRNVRRDERAYYRLVDMSGEDEVPCLAVNGAALLEAETIIGWLSSHLIRRSG